MEEEELFGSQGGQEDDGDDYEEMEVQQGLEDAERESQSNSPGGDLLDQVVQEGGGAVGPATGQSEEGLHPWVHRNARAPQQGTGGGGAGPSGVRPPRRIVDDDEDSSSGANPTREARVNATPRQQQGGGGDGPAGAGRTGIPIVDARDMDDFDPRYFGQGIQPNPPIFEQGTSSNSTWQGYDEVGRVTRSIRPLRTKCWNVPVELFARDGTRFRHWATPNQNTLRASQIAAIIGMAFTPTSKGFL